MNLGNVEISSVQKFPIMFLLDYIIDDSTLKDGDKLFKIVKYIIEETNNDWEKKLNNYFKNQKKGSKNIIQENK